MLRKFAHLPGAVVDSDSEVLRYLFEAVDDYAIYMLDRLGNVVTWNAGAERFKGYAANEILGENYACFFPAKAQATREPLKQLVAARRHGRFRTEGWRVRKGGSLFWADIVLTAVYDDLGKLIGFAKVTRDLTERKKQEDSLRAATQAAERANNAKSAFLANMSHELRTPLNAIIGFSELLLSQGKDAKNKNDLEYVQHIHDSGYKLLGIVNLILDFIDLESATRQLEMRPVVINELCQAGIDLVRSQAADAKISILLEEPIDGTINADFATLRQAISYILENAIKFNRAGGSVRMSVKNFPDHVDLVIVDTGIGIEATEMPQILSPFGQAENHFSRAHGGIGLGLLSAKKIIEFHGGSLSLESQAGTGTKVSVRLPLNSISL